MPRRINQQQPTVFTHFEHRAGRGGLRLISGFSRTLSVFIPSYYKRKVDTAAKELLEQLKSSYLGTNGAPQASVILELASQFLALNPSQTIASEINAYAFALFNKESRRQLNQNPAAAPIEEGQEAELPAAAIQEIGANPFNVAIDPALSARLEVLGLSLAEQREHPELMKMIQANDLADYLEGVNYKITNEGWEGTLLSFHSDAHDEPVLFIGGQPTQWSEAKTQLFGADINASTTWKLPEAWRLDSNGISPYSMANWETLTPCGRLLNHDGNFYLDIMSTTEGLNHNWVRLVNSNGEVISAGLCGEIYSVAMFRNSVGKLNSPDHREFFKPQTHRATRISITQETYENLKVNKLEVDQRTHNLFFSLMTRNCSKYACEVAQESGLNLDNAEFPSQLGARVLLNRVSITPPVCLLRVVQKVTGFFRSMAGMGFACVMGAWYQNPDVRELEDRYYDQWRIKPRKPFRSFRAFFDGTSSKMASSMKVGEWQEFVQAYRARRVEFLNEQRATHQNQAYFNTAEFQTAWNALAFNVSYEMPPELGRGHLFLNDARNISTADVHERITALATQHAVA
jgi:hypothetical protein